MSEILSKFDVLNHVNPQLKESIKLLHVFTSEHGHNALFTTSEDKVYGIGANDYGVCGLGHNSVVTEPQLIPELCDKSVRHFYNGSGFALALTSDGVLYGWGSNEWHQLGRGCASSDGVYHPVVVEQFDHATIRQVSCGHSHTLALTTNGVVYGWGANCWGQIGCGVGSADRISVATRVNGLPKVESIHTSFSSSFAITTDGLVYSWGNNRSSELGHDLERSNEVFEPRLIADLVDVKSICSSMFCTYILTNSGDIYFCGQYYSDDNVKSYQKSPRQLPGAVQSLHSVSCYERSYPIGCATKSLSDCVYDISEYNHFDKTEYKTIEEFYANEHQMTYQTGDMKCDLAPDDDHQGQLPA